jgi:hypothetical protein
MADKREDVRVIFQGSLTARPKRLLPHAGGSAALAVEFKAYPTVIEEIPGALSERLVDQDTGEGFRFSGQTNA